MGRAVEDDADTELTMTSSHHHPSPEQVHAVFAAEHSLIVEAVCTALGSSGLESERVAWPGLLPPPRGGPRPETARTVGLLLSDLSDWRQVRASGLVLRRKLIPWVVLTAARPGPLWGAVYEHGASVILSDRTSLDEVVTTLTALADGQPGISATPQQRLPFQAQWRELCERRATLSNRARALTPREREVLMLLYDGATIADIARLLQISTSTVRSQVKAIRQKLGVTSQLAAVAAYGSLIRPDPSRPLVRS